MPARYKQLAAGVYADDQTETIYLSLSEILAAHGWESTPANRELLAEAARGIYGVSAMLRLAHLNRDR